MVCSHSGNPIYTTRVHFGSPILVSIIKSISFVINFGRKGEIDDGNQKWYTYLFTWWHLWGCKPNIIRYTANVFYQIDWLSAIWFHWKTKIWGILRKPQKLNFSKFFTFQNKFLFSPNWFHLISVSNLPISYFLQQKKNPRKMLQVSLKIVDPLLVTMQFLLLPTFISTTTAEWTMLIGDAKTYWSLTVVCILVRIQPF